eukprot:5623602-Prymnesium_polylepis.1
MHTDTLTQVAETSRRMHTRHEPPVPIPHTRNPIAVTSHTVQHKRFSYGFKASHVVEFCAGRAHAESPLPQSWPAHQPIPHPQVEMPRHKSRFPRADPKPRSRSITCLICASALPLHRHPSALPALYGSRGQPRHPQRSSLPPANFVRPGLAHQPDLGPCAAGWVPSVNAPRAPSRRRRSSSPLRCCRRRPHRMP